MSGSSNPGHVEIKNNINQKPVANNEQDAGNFGADAPPVGKAKVIGDSYDESHQSNDSSNKKLKPISLSRPIYIWRFWKEIYRS